VVSIRHESCGKMREAYLPTRPPLRRYSAARTGAM